MEYSSLSNPRKIILLITLSVFPMLSTIFKSSSMFNANSSVAVSINIDNITDPARMGKVCQIYYFPSKTRNYIKKTEEKRYLQNQFQSFIFVYTSQYISMIVGEKMICHKCVKVHRTTYIAPSICFT